jgi:AAA+ ATPase superfamily predicted ATPase
MVGREEEIKKLEAAYRSNRAEFIGVYGRRRVGKTFLVNETFADRFVFRHAGLSPVEEEQKEELSDRVDERSMKRQLAHFHTSLLREGESGTLPPKNWEEAFFRMERLIDGKKIKGGKKVVFIDELPWMDTAKSGFITALEGFWNNWGCRQSDLLFIVAGSSTSWMTNKLINNHGGLYGRLTREIRLSPLTLGECKSLFRENGVVLSDYDVAQAYMVFGGIPFYLNPMEPGQSLAQYVDSCFFGERATLRREFDRLFASVFNNPETMKTIVRALAERRIGFTRKEIEEATKIACGGTMSDYLRALEDSDFIVEYHPFGSSRRESYYRLSDPFCWFYLQFVDGKESLRADFWLENLDNPRIVSWRGLAFENLCFLHIPQIKRALGISGVRSEESAYTKRGDNGSEGAQIDLLIVRADNVADLCEAKFVSDDYRLDAKEERKLKRREIAVSELLPKKYVVHKVLLTTFGIAEHEYMWSYQNVVTLKDLMI